MKTILQGKKASGVAAILVKTLPLVAAAGVLTFSVGCNTDAYCFANCATEANGSGTESTGTSGDGGAGGGGFVTSSNGFTTSTGGSSSSGPCEPTNGGIEICDGADNDCNDAIDDIEGLDLNSPKTCGTCDTNCYTQLINTDPGTVECMPSAKPGEDPGTCTGECADDYYDIDMDGQGCEYYCVPTANDDKVCNAKDDDCDGATDEDVDLCTDVNNCGKCGGTCSLAHATASCVHTGSAACSPANTGCEISQCEAGYVDLDGLAITGCEYQCTQSGSISLGGGKFAEECGDQVDNDCDGKVDGADDLSQDPAIGVQCFGDPDGVCGQAAHAGMTACIDGQVKCGGAAVLTQGQLPETCNSQDDDCDGVVDDAPTDAGMSCGMSSNAPCKLGTIQCNAGMLSCVGAVNPKAETCNGIDDDCDSVIDKMGGQTPPDASGTCGGYPAPPAGATSPCMNGMKACVGGTVQCQGSVGPTSTSDACGVDANCDGALTNQPNKMTDVKNCLTCGHDCNAGTQANYSCVNGGCVFQACLPGYYDLNNDGICEYQCTFVSAQEACNNQDDNCDGLVDNNPTKPSPVSICGVSPSAAMEAECSTGVQVQCMAGAWKCTFPAGVCSPTCATAVETCDGLDNDCDGTRNENVPDFGAACASDDTKMVKDGACRTLGTKVCNGGNATMCSAMTANCATLPGGCTELCDGVDNDCDGSVDETFNAKGTNMANFVKPSVVKIGSGNTWIYQYEASRPKANGSVPGSGNGYWTSAPMGSTLDKTPSCSAAGKVPWFNVTPLEAKQTCTQMGGHVCTQAEWVTGCSTVPPSTAPNACQWGYAPLGAACQAPMNTMTKFCNIANAFDFDPVAAGDQDGLLPAGSATVKNCWADWTTLNGNTAANGKVFDMTGNLREITELTPSTFKILGGAFNTQAESGATCSFDFYATDDDFKFYDTGFRCCFSANPTL